MAAAGEDASTPPDPLGAVRAVRSEKRLQALDFWLRNPDYLADEIVRLVEEGTLPSHRLDDARSMLDSPEPSLRHYPMPRWFYGAYEPLDDAMSLLEVHGLALMDRIGEPGKVRRTEFFLTDHGVNAAAEISAEVGPLQWYERQAHLVMAVAGTDSGNSLKTRQYAQAEYANTELGSTIAPIHDHVRTRLAQAAKAS